MSSLTTSSTSYTENKYGDATIVCEGNTYITNFNIHTYIVSNYKEPSTNPFVRYYNANKLDEGYNYRLSLYEYAESIDSESHYWIDYITIDIKKEESLQELLSAFHEYRRKQQLRGPSLSKGML